MSKRYVRFGERRLRVDNGAALGNFLRSAREEIATAEAGGAESTPDAVAEKSSALVEEMAAASGLTPDGYMGIEAGESEPNEEQANAIASVLSKHGVEVTAADLAAMSESEAAEPSEDDEMKAAEELKKKTDELTAATTEAATLRKQVETLTAAQADPALVEAGAAYLSERRASLTKRVEAKAGGADKVKGTVRARIENAKTVAELADLADLIDLDPMTDPMCAKCQKATAEEYRSSEPPAAGTKPAGSNVPRELTRTAISHAASAYCRRAEKDDNAVDFPTAVAIVNRMSTAKPDEFWALVDEK